MAEAIGVAASVVGLIATTVTIIQQVRNARDKVKRVSKTLGDVSSVLEATSETLNLVQRESQLQTTEVGTQVEAIKEVVIELQVFFDSIQKEQQKSKIHNFGRAFKSGDAEDKALAEILNRLQNARSELHTRILVTNVGLSGSLQDGYRVGLQVLQDTNVKVRQVLGLNLALAERLHNRELRRVVYSLLDPDTILLDPADVVALQLSDRPARDQASSESEAGQGQDERLRFYGNVTGDEPSIFVGSLGVEDTSKTSNSKADIRDNEFGKGAKVMVADADGEAAVNISKSFF
ncbi:hypothetical protein CKAH01_07029 [Colletotrichum kahawae]|uniref:Uncharacterized protein n=1 Tax=Colletotrichum kahawae TaxID=34407 RepID=A0AAE0D441_COLKA|nr:hypothetical protein CKAH01_07029 [Colletotrichum kahawae]